MACRRSSFAAVALLSLLVLALAAALPRGSAAATLDGLDGFDAIHGRYAPGGDCGKEPRITADRTGLTFEVAGATQKASRVEHALSYFGPDYEGISLVIFPFADAAGAYPIAMFFNADEEPGTLRIDGHEAGYPGGPPLDPRNAALVAASPYARCK